MSNSSDSQHEYTLPTNRIETLSDGVFAIVMTLLVLELEVPNIPEGADHLAFLEEFLKLWPTFFNYFLSFIILGVYWIGHHKQFHYIQVSDRILLWLNIFFLMFVALIPFSTSLLGTYPDRYAPIFVYTLNMIIVALLLYAKWDYATDNHHLVNDNLSPAVIHRGKRKILTGIFIYLVTSVVAAYYSATASLFLLILVPILYILPGRNWWKK